MSKCARTSATDSAYTSVTYDGTCSSTSIKTLWDNATAYKFDTLKNKSCTAKTGVEEYEETKGGK